MRAVFPEGQASDCPPASEMYGWLSMQISWPHLDLMSQSL